VKRLLSLALAASLTLAACGVTGGGGDVAATVGDSEVTVADVQAFPYEAGGTIETSQFAQYLSALIQWQILDNAAAEDFSVDPSEDEVETEMGTVLQEQAGGATLEEFAQSQNLSEDTIRRIVRVGLIQEQVADELGQDVPEPTSDEVTQALEVEKAGLTEVCARHVLVETAEEAEEARSRLEEGESFEAVAEEMSIDPSAAENGGDLGCAPAQQYVAEFRDAAVASEIDALTEPIQTQFGFHVLQVYDRTGPSAEEVPTEEEVREGLTEAAELEALQQWLLEKLDEAEVSVDEEYGQWVTSPQPMVQPPTQTTGSTAPGGTTETTAPGG
jgi:foldase protein PrsA